MCEYCQELHTGGDNESLLSLHINANEVNLIGVDVFINFDALEVYVDNSVGCLVAKAKQKIRYCPVCGQELRRQQNSKKEEP